MEQVATLQLLRPAFQDKGSIPQKYTCEGENINPPLEIKNIPEGTLSLILIMEDPDAPSGTFDHWLVWNIPPDTQIETGVNPGILGTNSAGKTGYHGPCLPNGKHKYIFTMYALSRELYLEAGAGKKELRFAMQESVLAKSTLVGYYG